MPLRYMSSAAVNAMIERVAPAVLELLADGEPRRMKAIVEGLAGRHSKGEVELTLMRIAVIGKVIDSGKGYTLPDHR